MTTLKQCHLPAGRTSWKQSAKQTREETVWGLLPKDVVGMHFKTRSTQYVEVLFALADNTTRSFFTISQNHSE